MTITTIKLSQEIYFNGMPTWIGLESTILPEENEIECLRTLQKSISEYAKEGEQKGGTKYAKREIPDEIQVTLDEINKTTTPEELSTWWLKSKGNLILSQAYKEKEKQLQNL